MTDRELLELAAKAVGYRVTWGEKYRIGDDEVDCTDMPYVLSDSPDEAPSYWNPLTDDGDALRLAVKLNLDVEPEDTFTMAACRFAGVHPRYLAKERAATDHEADRCDAMRRAIVRAAAEIGKGM